MNRKTEEQEIILATEESALLLAPMVARMSEGKETQAFCVEYEPCDDAFLRELWEKLDCEVEVHSGTNDSAVVWMNTDQLILVKSLDCVDRVSKNEALRARLNGLYPLKKN